MKAILLVRVSTDAQSLDEQSAQLVTTAKDKGYDENNLIPIEDKESAIKLSEFERKGLNRMKQHIETDKTINAVFVWELSRLTRKAKDAYSIRDYFIDNHIQLYCHSPKFQLLKDDLSDLDDNGSLLFALWVQMAEAEMRNKKERFNRTRVKNAKLGKYGGGYYKFGYKVNDKGYYEIDEEQAELIKMVFNRYEQGTSILRLTLELRERGIINTQNFVQGVLKSQHYTGSSNQYGLERTYPQIISTEQFERCREIARTNNKKLDKTTEIYYCKHLLKCTKCGSEFIAQKQTITYICYGSYSKKSRFNPSIKCCGTDGININAIDSLIWDIVKEYEIVNEKTNNLETIKGYEEQIQVCNEIIAASTKKIDNIEVKRNKYNTMYINNQIKEDKYLLNGKAIDTEVKEYNNLIVKSSNEIEVLQSKIEALNQKAKSLDMYLDKAWYLNELEDDKEIYEIIKQHVKLINFITESSTVKIITIYFNDNTSQQFKYYYRAIPQHFEIYNTEIYKGKVRGWQYYELEIKKRFTRKPKIEI